MYKILDIEPNPPRGDDQYGRENSIPRAQDMHLITNCNGMAVRIYAFVVLLL